MSETWIKPVPSIRKRLDKPNVKMTIKFFINNGELVAEKDGAKFVPQTAEVSIWPGRSHIKVTALADRNHYRPWPYAAQFDLANTKYPECPDWLRELVEEAIGAIE